MNKVTSLQETQLDNQKMNKLPFPEYAEPYVIPKKAVESSIFEREQPVQAPKHSKTYKGLDFGTNVASKGINLKWPAALQPFFHIETCTFCEKHQQSTRHKIGHYDEVARDLRQKIENEIPELQGYTKYQASPIQINTFNRLILLHDAVWVGKNQLRTW